MTGYPFSRRTLLRTGGHAALFAALARATGLRVDVDQYHVSSVTTGDDAQGQASVTARVDGAEHTGSGTSTDILEASALAWLEIANRAQRVRSAAPEREAVGAALGLWPAARPAPPSHSRRNRHPSNPTVRTTGWGQTAAS